MKAESNICSIFSVNNTKHKALNCSIFRRFCDNMFWNLETKWIYRNNNYGHTRTRLAIRQNKTQQGKLFSFVLRCYFVHTLVIIGNKNHSNAGLSYYDCWVNVAKIMEFELALILRNAYFQSIYCTLPCSSDYRQWTRRQIQSLYAKQISTKNMILMCILAKRSQSML